MQNNMNKAKSQEGTQENLSSSGANGNSPPKNNENVNSGSLSSSNEITQTTKKSKSQPNEN
jgi:hypothetical protein